MTLLLKQLFNLIKLINSDTETRSIAWGASLGFVLAMSPGFSLQTLLILLVMFFFRVQIGAALVSVFFFAALAYPLDPVFDRVGDAILSAEPLQGLFTAMYNLPLVPLTRFNNTITMGSGAVALALVPVVFFLTGWFVAKYREKIVARYKDSKFFKALKATKFYQWYVKYDEYFG